VFSLQVMLKIDDSHEMSHVDRFSDGEFLVSDCCKQNKNINRSKFDRVSSTKSTPNGLCIFNIK
jgi:hypothetical protein